MLEKAWIDVVDFDLLRFMCEAFPKEELLIFCVLYGDIGPANSLIAEIEFTMELTATQRQAIDAWKARYATEVVDFALVRQQARR